MLSPGDDLRYDTRNLVYLCVDCVALVGIVLCLLKSSSAFECCVVFVSEFMGEFVFVQACGCTSVQDNAKPQSKYTILSCTDRASCDGEKERRKDKQREAAERVRERGGEGGEGKRESESEGERERKREQERQRETESE
jgi:hypothetical protein